MDIPSGLILLIRYTLPVWILMKNFPFAKVYIKKRIGSMGIPVIDQHMWPCGVSRIANPTYIWRHITANPGEPKNLPVVFKITPAVHPANLDERLLVSGYKKDSLTSVQIVDLETANLQTASETELQDDLSDEWLEKFCDMSAVSELHKETAQKTLSNIIPRRCFVSLKSNGRVIACGLGVLQSDHIGLFDIVTDKEFRGRGYGQQIVKSILAWSRENKAKKAYLQVMLDNVPAFNLYSKIGFVEQYQYWYRIKSG